MNTTTTTSAPATTVAPTLEEVLARHEQEVLDHLDRQASVPIVDFARQGDVIVIPARISQPPRTQDFDPVPAVGVPLVQGENGGNTHLLVAEGDVVYAALFVPFLPTQQRVDIGVLKVATGAAGYLIHPEHGALGLLPGTYTVARQREFDGELQRVVFD